MATARQHATADVLSDETSVEVLVLGQPNNDDLVTVFEITAEHRRRYQSGGTDRTNGGRQVDCGLPITDQVGVTGYFAQEVDALLNGRNADLGVGVLGVLGSEFFDGLVGFLDAIWGVAQNVDRALTQLQATDTLGDKGHPGATATQAQGGGQAGQAGSDDNDVLSVETVGSSRCGGNGCGAHSSTSCCGVGRCSTSKVPWKIQSSRAV